MRLLFVFDPDRQAAILVGGDKAGNWSGWYRVAVPQAEQLKIVADFGDETYVVG
ncbi:hypothetical protein [Streptomyces sp. NPDC001714]|uniref:hypothetical protein n=1 Tax=Streptomyces sp. NPDC001714 TaxID=3364603 RepID=UPI0036753CAD